MLQNRIFLFVANAVAAFFDAFNGMVRALKNYEAQNVDGGLGRGGALKVN
ncbi:MAG TPA: hypothetical protein PLK61_08115 [Nitrosomonas sp.]|nr:hypothetical protein [Nitrosomonas sp.]